MIATCRGKELLASGLRWAEGVLTIGAEGYNVMSRGQNQKGRLNDGRRRAPRGRDWRAAPSQPASSGLNEYQGRTNHNTRCAAERGAVPTPGGVKMRPFTRGFISCSKGSCFATIKLMGWGLFRRFLNCTALSATVLALGFTFVETSTDGFALLGPFADWMDATNGFRQLGDIGAQTVIPLERPGGHLRV